jgi:hypothetical protein
MAAPHAPTVHETYQSSTKSITLCWSPPPFAEDTSPITQYRIECEDVPTIFVDASVTTYTVRDLLQQNLYTFRISAENEHGFGPAAEFPQLQPGCHKYGFV